MKYLIIGNSAAAVACIEAIRQTDTKGSITVLSKEKRFCYSRPLISYCLEGKTTKDKMNYRDDGFYDRMGVTLHMGVEALGIDARKKTVKASDDKDYPYDRLLVATGSVPFVPPADGLENVTDKYTFMSYDDMELLESACGEDKDVLIIGAGLIGLKCTEGILSRVKSVTVVDLANRVLPSVTDEESAEIVQKHFTERNVKFILGTCAESFEKNSVTLKNGQKLKFDILVTAAGVRPNVALVKAAGGKVGRGITVDARMRTSLDGVYAAGDCAEGYDSSVGYDRVLALMPNAYMQGKTAGINMAGGDAEYKNAVPLNSVGFFGLHMMSAGVYDGECIVSRSENGLKKFFVKDGVLKGFILVNEVSRAGIYTSLVRERTPLDSVDFELLISSPQLLAFDEETRANKLSRRV